MIDIGKFKYVWALQSDSNTNGETATSSAIDCQDYHSLAISVFATTSDNVTNNPSVLKLQESDDTEATNFADITKFVGDGTGGFTIPNSQTDDVTGPFVVFNVDLRGRKRYIQVVASPVTTQVLDVVGILGRANQMPDTAALVNAQAVING